MRPACERCKHAPHWPTKLDASIYIGRTFVVCVPLPSMHVGLRCMIVSVHEIAPGEWVLMAERLHGTELQGPPRELVTKEDLESCTRVEQ